MRRTFEPQRGEVTEIPLPNNCTVNSVKDDQMVEACGTLGREENLMKCFVG
jgi:hypothetical protein